MVLRQRAMNRMRAMRRRREGMTLIEIMIVVIIMAMIATAVGMAVLPHVFKSKEEMARFEMSAIRSALTLHVSDDGVGCPTVEALIDDGQIEGSGMDPWGTPYETQCEGTDLRVRSVGPDQAFGTEDDLSTDDPVE